MKNLVNSEQILHGHIINTVMILIGLSKAQRSPRADPKYVQKSAKKP